MLPSRGLTTLKTSRQLLGIPGARESFFPISINRKAHASDDSLYICKEAVENAFLEM